MAELRSQLKRIHQTLSDQGYDVRPLIFEPPATDEEIASLELEIGPIPPGFRKWLCSVSKHVEFSWFAPKSKTFPDPFGSNFCGDLHWSLQLIRQFNSSKNQWIEEVFPNRNDPYDAVWHDKLAFLEVGNGDYLAIDLSEDRFEQIVYLSHDDGEGHGHTLAKNFDELINNWVSLGCTGGEDWQWIHFKDDKSSPLDANCENANAWKRLLEIAV